MINVLPWKVECHRTTDGGFLIWPAGMRRELVEFKHILFGWHAPSFYGTMLDVVEGRRQEGVAISPVLAMDLFVQGTTVRWSDVIWGDTAQIVKEVAQLYAQVLTEGRLRPSFAAWRQGGLGWEPLWTAEELQAVERLQAQAERLEDLGLVNWFDSLMIELSKGQLTATPESFVGQEVGTAYTHRAEWWERAITARPELLQFRAPPPYKASANGEATGMDAEDWLQSIGWIRDDAPCRLVFRLDEPEEDSDPWKLQLLLRDREQPDVEIACQFELREISGETSQERSEAERSEASALASDDELIDESTLATPIAHIQPVTGAFPESWADVAPQVLERAMAKVWRLLPWLELKEDNGSQLKRQLTEAEAWTFLAEGSLMLTEAGFIVVVPAWWQRVQQLKTRLRAKVKTSAGGSSQSLIGLEHMMDFDWKVAIGDLELTETEFRELAEQGRRLVRIRGQWIQLSPDDLAQIRRMVRKVGTEGLTLGEVLELHLAEAAAQAKTEQDEEWEIDDMNSAWLEVELNDHLRALFEQLQRNTSLPVFDPPSKLLGTLRPYQQEGYSWLTFLRRFGLGACLADDMGLGKTIQWIAYLLRCVEEEPSGPPSLLVCPTSVLGNWQKELERFAPSLRIYMHYGSKRAQGEQMIAEMSAAHLVLTTYTTALNDHDGLSAIKWSTICLDEAQNIKNPYTKQSIAMRKLNAHHRIALTGTPMENRLTELWSIFDFINPGYLGTLAQFRRTYVNPIERTRDTEWIGLVQKLVKPFLLRRLKKDPAIQLELPEKNEAKAYVTLSVEQAALYEQVLDDMFNRIDQLETMERRGAILAALAKLKQVCNHPALYHKEDATGWEPERSGKLVRLLEMVDELRSEGDSCLIFTQYVETGHMLKAVLEQGRQERVYFLHGGVPKASRDEMVEHFQDASLPEAERASIFILSLKAGGTGLNLTAANHVFHYDRWWNPAVENQASDRAFRIGQTRDVQVHKLIALGTLEERIDEMIEQKQHLSDQVVGSGEAWVTELSTSELRELFALRAQWTE
ncbi:DEAD/DEAH box helicase [Paenibacillus sp. 481]|uniref:DEAD/DEAH box helicase n=1 Tax=Paenibacillus sp. 481 TaxID=2835869 RepID=UPI001E4868AB|nr:DEAD/DEAH box helicase [Paenibacillus sp. 481]UHA74977.1 DEAD/DEAH box helicase [Paenibacillus sp. 481]